VIGENRAPEFRELNTEQNNNFGVALDSEKPAGLPEVLESMDKEAAKLSEMNDDSESEWELSQEMYI
jgi:hypothetical protein